VWLRDHRIGGPVIVHGDFRLGNVMFAARGPARLTAIFDWEMATAGDPLADLGYFCATWAQDGDPDGLLKLTRATSEPGYPTRQELAELRPALGTPDRRDPVVHGIRAVEALRDHGGNYRRAIDGSTDNAFVREFGRDVPAMRRTPKRSPLRPDVVSDQLSRPRSC
jgi:aminoglycoside phosphotransferase (APT) family kinase protein